MKHGKGDLSRLRRIEKADVAQCDQRRRQQAGANVDYGDGGGYRIQRIEDFHLIRSRGHIDDLGQIGMKTPQRATGGFGVEGAGGYVVGAEIIKQGARDRGLADPALVSAYHNHYWLRHELPLQLQVYATGTSPS